MLRTCGRLCHIKISPENYFFNTRSSNRSSNSNPSLIDRFSKRKCLLPRSPMHSCEFPNWLDNNSASMIKANSASSLNLDIDARKRRNSINVIPQHIPYSRRTSLRYQNVSTMVRENILFQYWFGANPKRDTKYTLIPNDKNRR